MLLLKELLFLPKSSQFKFGTTCVSEREENVMKSQASNVQKKASDCFVELLLAAARALGPVIRRFISLGLNRVWLDAGSTAYRQGLANFWYRVHLRLAKMTHTARRSSIERSLKIYTILRYAKGEILNLHSTRIVRKVR